MTDYYTILGVSRTASPLEIRDAYLKLARDTHPDKVKNPEARKKAEDAFKNVTAAYDTLSKDRSRREYSAKLPVTSDAKAPAAPKASPPVVKGPPLPSTAGAAAAQPGSVPAASVTSNSAAIPSSGRAKFDALGRGIEAFNKQDYHSAVQLLKLAVDNEENNAKAHAMLSLALGKNPHWVRDAVSHMETASRLEPKNVSYLVELALLLQSQGLRLRARRALDSAIAISPDHPDVARGLKEIPAEATETAAQSRSTSETSRSLLDRFRKR